MNPWSCWLAGMIMDIVAPVKSRSIFIRPNATWYNEDIGTDTEWRRLERRWRSSHFESGMLSYVEQ